MKSTITVAAASLAVLAASASDPSDWSIDGTYTSITKIGNDTMCPSEVKIDNSMPLSEGLVAASFNEIEEDGESCAPAKGRMLSYRMNYLETEEGLNEADKNYNYRALLASNKLATIQLSSDSFVVEQSRISFDDLSETTEPVRRCGNKSYRLGSFYFNIKGGVGNSLTIRSGRFIKAETVTHTFGEGQNGLFILASDSNRRPHFCVLRTSNTPAVENKRAIDSSDACFPASATVELEGGLVKRMEQLAVGDRVLAAYCSRGVHRGVWLHS